MVRNSSTSSNFLTILLKSNTHALIPLYTVGVFISFTLSQYGMFVKWMRTKDKGWQYKSLINGFIYFTAETPVEGRELWRTDGTTAGTTFVKDIVPGSGASNYTNAYEYALTTPIHRVHFSINCIDLC